MLGRYVLGVDGKPLLMEDFLVWARWLETADRTVAVNHVEGVDVSTVFLGLDQNFSGKGDPMLWETMIFGGEHDQEQWRYTSREEALLGHVAALALVCLKPVEHE
jgi:hypothetical protein